MGSKESPWQRPIFVSGVPEGTRVCSLNFEIDNIKRDPLHDDIIEAVSAFVENFGKEHPNLGQFIYELKASAYLDPILSVFDAKVRNWEHLMGFTATDRSNNIHNSLGKHFSRADLSSSRDGIHFYKDDQSVDGPIFFCLDLFSGSRSSFPSTCF